MEGLEDMVRRLKAQVDELTRQNQDLSGWKARLSQENYELQRQVQELDSSNGALAKQRTALQQQLDEAKARLDEESRVSRPYHTYNICKLTCVTSGDTKNWRDEGHRFFSRTFPTFPFLAPLSFLVTSSIQATHRSSWMGL